MTNGSSDKFQSLVDQLPGYIAYVNAETLRYEFVNKGYENVFGIPREKIVGAAIKDIIGEANYRFAQKFIDEAKSGKSVSYENVFNTVLGKRWIQVNFSPLFDKDGRVATIVLLNHDITERKLAEEAMLISESKYRQLFEVGSDPIFLVSADTGQILDANRMASTIYGYDREEFLSMKNTDISAEPEETRKGVEALPLNSEQSSVVSLRYHRKKDSAVFPVEITARSFVLNGRKVLYAASRDISRRIRAEEEHLKYEQQLQLNQRLESLGVLAGGIAHDFNNLMGGIFGYIDLAKAQPDPPMIHSYLSKAMAAIDRARSLTRQLLTFAKGGAPVRKTGHLFPFVRETAQFALSGASVSCRFDAPKDLWACNFDKDQIGQVIDNMIINAQQAMPLGGTIELSARNIILSEKEHPFLAGGNYVKISIKDGGVGIPKELLTRIFDPFFTTKPKGHGLGLATCYSIVTRHNGYIDVESMQGIGSTFHVYLPASAETDQSGTGKRAQEHTGCGTFLIMDDEIVMQETFHGMLASFGYTVVCKENGKDAVDFFTTETKQGKKIVGAIFDLTVPGGMGGKAAIEEIRKLNTTTPVFVASGYAEDPVMKDPTNYGFTASICKPFTKSELMEMLNDYLNPHK